MVCCLTSYKQTGKAALEMWMLGTGSAAVMVRLWNLMSGEEEAGQQERLQPWATKELTLSSSEMFLEETHWNSSCRNKGSRRLG